MIIPNKPNTIILDLIKKKKRKKKFIKEFFTIIKLLKYFVFSILFLEIIIFNKIIFKYRILLNKEYLEIQKNIHINFKNRIKNKIRIGIYSYGLKNGGIERITSLLLNYLNNITIFDLYFFTMELYQENEFKIPEKIKRLLIKNGEIGQLIKEMEKNRIQILIYQFIRIKEINILNKLPNKKIIYYQHSSLFLRIYVKYSYFKSLYKEYLNSKYILSLIPLENDYIFQKWGINSILMNNFITYEYFSVSPSNLSSETILMIGRANDLQKRFKLGINAMEFITKEIPKSNLKIISNLNETQNLQNIKYNLNLENSIEFIEYTPKPEKFFTNASLHILPSISESFSLVLSEVKVYGIPSILLGINYISIANKGTVIIYDDNPECLAKISISILKNDKYKIKLAEEARLSMKNYSNRKILKKWNKLLLSIYNSDIYFQKLRNKDHKISKKLAISLLETQINLLHKRNQKFKNITIHNFLNFTFLEHLEI